jgi:4-amino-4-deoxy-L-arabinose transferase-like glycosyltransferase
MLLALLMLIIPIVIMSFFRDRKERYLLPMIVPASVVIARAVVEHVRTRHLRHAADLAVVAIHWTTLLFIAIGLPLAGVMSLKRLDGGPWFSPALAAIAAALGVAIVVGGMVAHRKCPGRAIAGATLLLMLGMQLLFMHGYRASREGLSEMKPLAMMIRERAPEARLFSTGSKIQRAPSDLSIYLNRPVVWVDNASEIPSSARPAVIVIRQRKGESPPSPPPGGSVIGKTARDEGWWYAFEMP